jgi:hypothetical protein
MMRVMGGDGPMGFDHGPMMRVMSDVIRLHHGGFDATGLAEILKVETGAEAHALAQNAVDANAAAQKAALALPSPRERCSPTPRGRRRFRLRSRISGLAPTCRDHARRIKRRPRFSPR